MGRAPNRRAPVVAHMVWYKTGAADEPRGKSGIAHFFEHLMFKGTKLVPPGEFSKIIARHGGSDNAFTTQDYTAYFQTVARDKLGLVMRLEADRMRNLVLTDAEVLPERDVVLEERAEKLRVLSGVREFPTRVKCATLPWHTMVAALKGENEISTE